MAPHHARPWSPTWRLTWSDFQGAPPRGGNEAAKTAYGLYSAWRCRGSSFEFRVVAALHPRDSWVKPEVVADTVDSRRALGHEQAHFDIAEVWARRMRRHFRRLATPCSRSDADLSAEAQRFEDQASAMQSRYDEETGHGLRPREQAAWQLDVAWMLVELREEGDAERP